MKLEGNLSQKGDGRLGDTAYEVSEVQLVYYNIYICLIFLNVFEYEMLKPKNIRLQYTLLSVRYNFYFIFKGKKGCGEIAGVKVILSC